MLVLKYDAAAGGAPDQYGDAADRLIDRDGGLLQVFRKAQAGFMAPKAPLSAAVDAWLAKRGPRGEPVVVMVHGYQFDPGNVSGDGTDPDSPFGSVYGPPPAVDHHMSWLPLVGECDQTGGSPAENAIAFCYKSEAGMTEFAKAGWNNSYQYAVFDQSTLAARALAAILVSLSGKVATVRILAHSLGTRTTSQAIRLAKGHLAPSLDRVLLLDGAEFSVDALVSFADCTFDVFNITNRTDKVLKVGGDQMCHPFRLNGSASAGTIGFDGLGGNDRWLDLQLDNPDLVKWFAAQQAPTGTSYSINGRALEKSHPNADLDHWSCYTNDGNRALMRDLLFSEEMTVAGMKARGVPDGTDSPLYGGFNGFAVPPTPQSRAERRGMLERDNTMSGGGGS